MRAGDRRRGPWCTHSDHLGPLGMRGWRPPSGGWRGGLREACGSSNHLRELRRMYVPTQYQVFETWAEQHTKQLLVQRGYSVRPHPTNFPTYDLFVTSPAGKSFQVSVKASRTTRHVRLGREKSVRGLKNGDFVFAYVPTAVGCGRRLNFDPPGRSNFDPGTNVDRILADSG